MSGVNILVPYWADADTRPAGGGTVYYRETTNTALLDRASTEIQNAFGLNFSATYLFIATWDAIGYYSNHIDKVTVNDFFCAKCRVFVILRYWCITSKFTVLDFTTR